MAIYQDGTRFYVRIDLPRELGKRRDRVQIGGYDTRTQAERAERKALTDREDERKQLKQQRTTVAEVGEKFFTARVGLSPTTAHRYGELWRIHVVPHLGGAPIAKVKAHHIEELYVRLQTQRRGERAPLSGQTVKHVHRLLFTVWRWAEKKSFVAQNQMRLVDAPEAQASPGRSLDPEEAVLVLQAARGTRWEAFVLLALISGARRGELLAIRWNAIDINGQSMTIRSNLIVDRRNGLLIEKSPKGGRSRTIPLSNQAVDALRQLRDSQSAEKKTAGKHYVDRGFVFADELGYPRHPDAVTKAYTVIRKRAGTPHSRLHDLRHSMASWALAGGSDLHTVQMLLGHSAPSTTANVYGHVIAGRERSATDAVTSALARGRMALEAKVVRESLPQSGSDGQILGQVALMKRGADTAKRQKNQ